MPTEFALLRCGSAYEPFAYSRSRAAGLWQFIPGTGVRFGLKQTWWYDGRRTCRVDACGPRLPAALHDEFNGDWLFWRSPRTTSARPGSSAPSPTKPRSAGHGLLASDLPAETAPMAEMLAMKRSDGRAERYA